MTIPMIRDAVPVRSTDSVFGSLRLLTLLWGSMVAVLMIPLTTLIDVPIATWVSENPMPGWGQNVLGVAALYSQGLGVLLIIGLVVFAMPSRRRGVARLAVLGLGAGLWANLAKVFVMRPRPGSLQFDALNNEFAWIWNFDWTLVHLATFDPGTRAFPSASLATATALTVGLWGLTPKVRPIAVFLCIGTMLQRVLCGAHFASDLFGSAAVALAWAFICGHPRLLGSVFDRIEGRVRFSPQTAVATVPAGAEATTDSASSADQARAA
ncbi:phosphatase PAP2 family protein [Rubripirellula lacrimiformis]|nr:phosphatase PAP2 family protein [Rubripirellula lacrimiformis]